MFLCDNQWRFLTISILNFEADFLEGWKYIISIQNCHIKTNKALSTKWTYHKERSFASSYFIFSKILFQFKASYKELIWCTNDPTAHIPIFCKRWSFIRRCFFPVRILKQIIISKSLQWTRIILKLKIVLTGPLCLFTHCSEKLCLLLFSQNLHLRCFTGFWIRLYKIL